MTLRPEIAQAMVYGDRRPHLVALLVPDHEWARSWAIENGKHNDMAELCEDQDFRRVFTKILEQVNATLSPIEKVRRTLLSAEPFTTDNQMMTPTMKIRRHVVRERFGERLEALYHTP